MESTSGTGFGVLGTIVGNMKTVGIANYYQQATGGQVILVLCPEHAAEIAASGLSKSDVKDFVFHNARMPVGQLKGIAHYGNRTWPAWIDESNDGVMVPIVRSASDVSRGGSRRRRPPLRLDVRLGCYTYVHRKGRGAWGESLGISRNISMETSKPMSYREMLLSQNSGVPEPAATPPIESIRARLEASRRELLDLGMRNPLLNYRTLRAKGVDVVGESAVQVFDALTVQGKAMAFLPGNTGDDTPSLWEGEIPLPVSTANQSDNRLQTAESPENLDKRLLNTYRDANTSIEETGVNTLFLALGMLRWYEADASTQPRYAPLVLVPVRLERTGARERFTIRYSGEDLGVNLSLIEKVRIDFGLVFPGQETLVPEDRNTDIAGYMAEIADVIRRSGTGRWVVEPDRIALGFFSFNKLLMYLDLDPNNTNIAENGIIAALFGDGFRDPPSSIPGGAHLDSHIRPQDAYYVLDADSSQSLAIHDAASGDGRNLVIQGPPGTGKSQTITNLIADAVGHGKRVLFVSEKMAALEVVKRRLDSVGLGQACLELHSNKTNKRQTLEELGRTLNLEESYPPAAAFHFEELSRAQGQLNDYSAAVNTPRRKQRRHAQRRLWRTAGAQCQRNARPNRVESDNRHNPMVCR